MVHYGQPVAISLLIKSIEPHLKSSKCIKSEPSEGSPFEEVSKTIHRQLTKVIGKYPTCTMYTVDSFYWDDVRVNADDLSSINLDAYFDKRTITLAIDSFTIRAYREYYFGNSTSGEFGSIPTSNLNFDASSHSFLIHSNLPKQFDTLLFEEVYYFLRYDTTVTKYDHNFNRHTALDANYLVSKLDTISSWTCYGENASHREKVSIERTLYDKSDFGINLIVRVNYNDTLNSFHAKIDYIGIYKDEYDSITGTKKYSYPFAHFTREDFVTLRADLK
jgi:hypothetical protein